MPSAEQLQARWEARVRAASIEPALAFTEAGLTFGAGTVLAKRIAVGRSRPMLAIAGNEERILALLAVAYGRSVKSVAIDHIRRAGAHYACGEIGLALIHLARARLPRFADPKGAAYRVFIGEALLDDGLAPRDLLKICDIDPSILDWIKKDFDPAEPRIPAGNGIESGEWTNADGSGVTPVGNGVQNGDATHDYGSTIIPVAARQIPDEYRTGDPNKFFDTLYGPVHALAQRLGIDETWLFGLAAHESGWLDQHNRDLNDPFGVTHGGGPNVAYSSIDDAVAYWEHRYGPIVRGATSARNFVSRLHADHYNTADPTWSANVSGAIESIQKHLSAWRLRGGGI
jgi:hypothetical protein